MIRRYCKVRISFETEIVVRFDDKGKVIKTGKTEERLKEFLSKYGTYCNNAQMKVLKKGEIYDG